MTFLASYDNPGNIDDHALIYLLDTDGIVIKMANGIGSIPTHSEYAVKKEDVETFQYIGLVSGTPCYAVGLKHHTVHPGGDFRMLAIRKGAALLSEDQLQGALYASHIVHWDKTTKFCGGCGHSTELSANERAKTCPECGMLNFPRISPAVIVAVIKDNQILLGHSGRFPHMLYSVIAGFVEPGETLEACVAREVKEETGIDVKDIRYFSSQPWPFPDSLMIAFTAQYAGGEINVDGVEMTDAAWFRAESLPTIPDKVSIARKLIDWFITTKG